MRGVGFPAPLLPQTFPLRVAPCGPAAGSDRPRGRSAPGQGPKPSAARPQSGGRSLLRRRRRRPPPPSPFTWRLPAALRINRDSGRAGASAPATSAPSTEADPSASLARRCGAVRSSPLLSAPSRPARRRSPSCPLSVFTSSSGSDAIQPKWRRAGCALAPPLQPAPSVAARWREAGRGGAGGSPVTATAGRRPLLPRLRRAGSWPVLFPPLSARRRGLPPRCAPPRRAGRRLRVAAPCGAARPGLPGGGRCAAARRGRSVL